MTYGRQAKVNDEINWVTDEDNNVVGYMKDDKTLVAINRINNGREVFTAGTTASSDLSDDNTMLVSNSSSSCTYTLNANTCPNGVSILMRGTGSINVVAGAGVTIISVQTQTFTRGDIVCVIPTGVDNEYIVKVV